jgi:DNA polymerase-3 subunit epsilon
VYLGPLASRAGAQVVIEAIQSALPVRRCTQRIGRNLPLAGGAPCTAAQLGVAACPCSGMTPADAYARIAREVELALTSQPQLVLGPLQERMAELAGAQRFEEAAAVRDRAAAFAAAVRRQRLAESLRAAGALHVRSGAVDLHVVRGRLVASGDGLPMPLAVEADGAGSADDRPPGRLEIDEMLILARHLADGGRKVQLLECDGTWTSPVGRAADPAPLRRDPATRAAA